MPDCSDFATVLTTKLKVDSNCMGAFVDWQASLHKAIVAFDGFTSLEILSPADACKTEWVIVHRFSSREALLAWRESAVRKALIRDLEPMLSGSILESDVDTGTLQAGVTEVFVTEVKPNQEPGFKDWIAKIHHAEAKFPGFRGVYVQSPTSSQDRFWITFLQFDTPANLDAWLTSNERKEVLEESKPLVSLLERHRMITPFAGWFSSIAKRGEIPAVWKQTMVVLLLLFPIVMLEIKYLNPWASGFGSSLGTFIGNAISVTLISWPLMPLAIMLLGWWLSPYPDQLRKNIIGTLTVALLYILEIALFWNFT